MSVSSNVHAPCLIHSVDMYSFHINKLTSSGLFTPNAGQHFRDEQRRRRSQYDRGTRLAALEEYNYEADYDTSAHHRPLYDTATQ